MTILFTASKLGDKERYKHVISAIEHLGHSIKVRDIFTSSKNNKTSFKLKRDLEITDFMIAELTEPSITTGLEIATAVNKSKHVLIMHSDEEDVKDLSAFITENPSRYIHICSYNKNNINLVLDQEIKKIKKQLNFVLYVELPTQFGDMLNNLQKETKKSKKQIIQEALKDYTAKGN